MRYVVKPMEKHALLTIFDTVENKPAIRPTKSPYVFSSRDNADRTCKALNEEAGETPAPDTKGNRGRAKFSAAPKVDPAPKKDGTKAATGKFSEGDRVTHGEFGDGTVKSKDGIRCTITFDSGDERAVLVRMLKKGPEKSAKAPRKPRPKKSAEPVQAVA